jgi:hypothetical protein
VAGFFLSLRVFMASILNGVKFLASASGTGDFTVASASTGYQTPATAGAVNGKTYRYRAENASLTQWEIGFGVYTGGVLARTTVLFNSLGTTAKINFSTIPTVGITFLKEDILSMDDANGFTSAQKSQGRANLDVLKNNYIINGAMMISQENGTTAGTTSGYYPVDLFSISFSNAGAISVAQVASATPGGSPNRIRATVTTADASVAAGDFCNIVTKLEGFRVADLRLGNAAAKTVTVQFGMKAPAGTYCVAIRNSASNRSYVGEVVVSAPEANTDVVKSVTIALDQTGTWLTDTGIGLELTFNLMVGTTFQTTANTWAAGSFTGTSNQFNFMGTLSNVFELFDVGVYEGTVAPSFQVPDYPTELRQCMRYYWKDSNPTIQAEGWSQTSGNAVLQEKYWFPVPMRIAPTVSNPTFSLSSVASVVQTTVTTTSVRYTGTSNASTTRYFFSTSGGSLVANARL